MAEKLTVKEVIHILETDHGFRIYKNGNKYRVWKQGWNAPYSWNRKNAFCTARDIHRIYGGYLRGVPWSDILKKTTHGVSRRIIRDAINTEEFEKIPQHELPFMDNPRNYD